MIDRKNMKGVSLVEMLLVLTIISAVIYMAIGYYQQKARQMRIDRTVLQMQQILNAGLSYYVANSRWPVSNGVSQDMTNNTSALQTDNYLPNGIQINSPWSGNPYFIYTDANGRAFTVYTNISMTNAGAVGLVIAGSLPIGFTSTVSGVPPFQAPACSAASASCWVSASVNIPGQNLNNARAVNFTGLVKHGGCVPVPDCPVDAAGNTMTPQVQIIPVSVSGYYYDSVAGDENKVYPISSFTAYAKGPSYYPTNPVGCDRPLGAVSTVRDCYTTYQGASRARGYWRACLQVVTEQGDTQNDPNTTFGNKVQLMAITRCHIQNESGTSNTGIYSN
jgi:type II secretory pathway pseudopilin PulG